MTAKEEQICPHCGSTNTVWKAKAQVWECGDCEERFASFPAGATARSGLRIFLSYGHDENTELVRRIKADLEKPENGGHLVWIDDAEIKFSDDWRRKITDGIQDSDWMLAFLSKHSVRDPGVCRDELAIALGTKGGIISTVLVERPGEVKPPVSVSHVQWLDMHEWKAKKAESEAAFEAWYAEKFTEIRRVLDNPRTKHFAGEIEWLAEKLTPVPYAARIGELLGKGFVGREWLAREIEDWRTGKDSSRVFCITGEPGIGKSAIAAWMAHTNKAEVVAVHFCRYDQPNWSDPGQIIRSIAFQMATRLDDYRRFLIGAVDTLERQAAASQQQQLQSLMQAAGEAGAEPGLQQSLLDRLRQANPLAGLKPAELFESLIANAAHYGIAGGRQRYLIIVDALDEAGAQLAEFIAQRAESLPGWLAFLVTSRPGDSTVMPHLERLHPHIVKAGSQENLDDLRAYIRDWLTTRGLPPQKQAEIVEPLLRASEGNFLYLATFRSFVEEGRGEGALALENPACYPKGLSSLYHTFFQRQFPDAEDYRTRQAPFLRLVAAARRPLPEELARRILDLDEETFRIRVLQPLGSLFQRQAGSVEPFHKSLRDWLADDRRSTAYFVSVADGHRRLGEALWQELQAWCEQPGTLLSDYALTELPHHLLAWPGEDLVAIIPDQGTWLSWRGVAAGIAEQLEAALRWREAEGWLRLKVRLDEQLLGSENSETAASLNRLALLLQAKGDYAEAEPLYRRTLAIREKSLGPEHQDIGISLNNLAMLLKRNGGYAEAESLCRGALAIQEKVLGPNHPDTATSLNNLASLLMARGDYAGAEPFSHRALAIVEKELGPEHANTAASLNNLAGLLKAKGDYVEAELLCRRALAIREKTLGTEHPDTAIILNNLAALLHEQYDYAEAEPLVRRALAILEKTLGFEHPDTATSLNNLAMLLQAKGDYAEAELHHRRALAVWEKALGPEHPDTAISLNNLATLLEDKGDYAEAEPLYRRILEIRENVYGPEHPGTVRSLNTLANLLQNRGAIGEAEHFHRRLLVILEKALGPEHPDTAASLENLASLLEEKGDYAGAESLYCRLLAIKENTCGQNHLDAIEAKRCVAICLRQQGRFDEARDLFVAVVEARKRLLGERHEDTLLAEGGLGTLYAMQGAVEQARSILTDALDKAVAALGPSHFVTQGAQEMLARLDGKAVS